MAKGFILAITTATILVVLMLFAQSFSIKQLADLDRNSQILVSEKVVHTWSDVKDDIAIAPGLVIIKDNNSVSFLDKFPVSGTMLDFLHLYGRFIQNYYKTQDVDIKFLSPDGRELDLGNLPLVVMILPQNIMYNYSNEHGSIKDDLMITVPLQNASSVTQVFITVNVSNAYLYCKPVNSSASSNCESFSPNRPCGPTTVNKLYLNLTISDYRGGFYRFKQNCFEMNSLGSGSNDNIVTKNATGTQSVSIEIGEADVSMLPQVIDIYFHNVSATANTTLILNTSDFYINSVSQIKTDAIGYNTSRTDKA